MGNGTDNKVARVTDQRRTVVEQIVSDMESFGGNWTKPWVSVGVPVNAVSKRPYRGGNRMHLSVMARKCGYTDPRWATFNQAKQLGWKLRKGEKSAIVEKWKECSFVKENVGAESEEPETEVRKYLRLMGYWSVFNADQFEDVEPYESNLRSEADTDADRIADDFIECSRCAVYEELTNEAYYSPSGDFIRIPERSQFATADSFLRVLWHEMGHSTANSESLARRDLKGGFGSAEYAFEELIAELTSAFTAETMGCIGALDIESTHYKQHLAYLKSWISKLHDDPDQLFKAAAVAEKASCYLIESYKGAARSEVAA